MSRSGCLVALVVLTVACAPAEPRPSEDVAPPCNGLACAPPGDPHTPALVPRPDEPVDTDASDATPDAGGDTDVGAHAEDDRVLGTTVWITPSAPLPGERVTCTAIDERDGGARPVSSYTWSIDGRVVGTGQKLDAPGTPGTRITCVATWSEAAGPSDTDPAPGGVPVPTHEAQQTAVVRALDGPDNVLVVVLDDIGIDRIPSYAFGNDLPTLPTLDRLADEGVQFDTVWATPTCSPTRATVVTGRHPHQHGVGIAVPLTDPLGLPLREMTYAELLRDAAPVAWSQGFSGKWHLSTFATGPGSHVLDQGWDTYAGFPSNYRRAETFDGAWIGYRDHPRYVDDEAPVRDLTYATTSEVDDALRMTRELPSPWIVTLAFHAGHSPAHVPPPGLYHRPTVTSSSPTADKYDAMLEAVDTELGRLLDAVDPATTVFVFGDNGTDANAIRGPYTRDQVKISFHEGGVRVPMVVSGPLVVDPGRRVEALVHVSDVFATLAEIARVPADHSALARTDSHSLLPFLVDPDRPGQRRHLFTERLRENGPPPYSQHVRLVRTATHKVIDLGTGVPRAWHRLDDPAFDGPDLRDLPLDAADVAAFEGLERLLDEGRYPFLR